MILIVLRLGTHVIGVVPGARGFATSLSSANADRLRHVSCTWTKQGATAFHRTRGPRSRLRRGPLSPPGCSPPGRAAAAPTTRRRWRSAARSGLKRSIGQVRPSALLAFDLRARVGRQGVLLRRSHRAARPRRTCRKGCTTTQRRSARYRLLWPPPPHADQAADVDFRRSGRGFRLPSGSFESAARWTTASKPRRSSVKLTGHRCSAARRGPSPGRRIRQSGQNSRHRSPYHAMAFPGARGRPQTTEPDDTPDFRSRRRLAPRLIRSAFPADTFIEWISLSMGFAWLRRSCTDHHHHL